jgi:hypothetical protein
MELTKRAFKKPIPCARLLALRVTKWPSKSRWAYVPKGTERIEKTTPVTLLAFPEPDGRDASPEELDTAERLVASAVRKAGLIRFLTSDHLEDVISSLKREISGAKTAQDKRLLKASYEDLLYRAITKYWRDDAFLGVYGWTTERGTVVGVIDEYRAPDLENPTKGHGVAKHLAPRAKGRGRP